jgi:hypothetical protein
MRLLIATLFTAALLSTGTAASAGNVNPRQQRQDARIDAGIAQGDLTRAEADALRAQQRSIARQEARMRSDDGVLGVAERARLDARQDHANDAIRRQRHDRQQR